MELKINDYNLPEVVSFNFEELKSEISAKLAKYENMVYSEDQFKVAKADRADLNRLKKALNDERIKREKEYLKPFNEFKAQIKEIISLIDKPIAAIDSQIKAVEDEKKGLKLDEIMDNYANIDFPDWVTFDKLFDEKWLNVSVSLASVQKELETKKEQIEADILALQNLPEYSFEAIEVYKTSLNLVHAMQEGRRLAEIQKKKAEQEALPQAPQPQEEPKPEAPEVPKTPKNWVSFSAYINVEDAVALREFFKSRNIEYKAI